MNQTPFLENVVLYTCDGEVYKIFIEAHDSTLKRAKKVGINDKFTLIKEGLPRNKIISPKEFDISKGKFIVQFSFKTRGFNVFPGEDFCQNAIESKTLKSNK
jgi:hypothetical protein